MLSLLLHVCNLRYARRLAAAWNVLALEQCNIAVIFQAYASGPAHVRRAAPETWKQGNGHSCFPSRKAMTSRA